MLRITVVTPSLNMGAYLEKTICSVLDNLQPEDEYFIIDGGSADDSIKIIESYKDKITGWISEEDHGYADALTKGFNRATGDVFCWINAGDIFLPGCFDKVRDIFATSDVGYIYGDDFYIDENDKVIFHSNGNISNLRNAMYYGGWTPLQDACFWRKELYKKVGGIDPALKYAADYDLFLKFSVYGESQYVSYTFSAFRRHENQKSISGSLEYKKEKRFSQKLVKQHLRENKIKYIIFKVYYWFYVRFKARVLQKLNANKKFNGLPVECIEKIR